MKPNDKAYREFMRVYNKTHVSLEAQIMASLTAAYAAQFKIEEYAGLVKELRSERGCTASPDDCLAAADVIELMLAETDWWGIAVTERQKRIAAEKERDALRADLAAVTAERDALKAENESMKQSLPLWAHKQMAANNELIERLRAERDALAARLAPVDDEALVEIVANAILLFIFESPDNRFDHHGQARAAISAIRPHIEAAERERCAKIAETPELWVTDKPTRGCDDIAAAIRSGK